MPPAASAPTSPRPSGRERRSRYSARPKSSARPSRPSAPALLGFSNYLWNLELSYEVIRQAKAAAPQTIVVMGGPNYPTDADGQRAFLERYPLVDFYVYKEGEAPFLALGRAAV